MLSKAQLTIAWRGGGDESTEQPKRSSAPGRAPRQSRCLRPRASSKVEAEPSATQGAGGSGPTNPLQRQSTKVMTANMEERARQQKYNPYAKCTFPKSKAQAVEERARQQYLVRTSCLAGL